MISRIDTILTVALPLGFCLVVTLSIAVILYFRLENSESRRVFDLAHVKRPYQLPIPVEVPMVPPGAEDQGVYVEDLIQSYSNNLSFHGSPLNTYIDKWMPLRTLPFLTQKERQPDEVSRLESILFAEPLAMINIDIDRDGSIFPNPQNYTAAEIVDLLHTENRSAILHHIMASMLLKNTYFRGNINHSLLPFDSRDIDGLYNLSVAVRNGLELHTRLKAHICRFGFYKAKRRQEPEYFWKQYFILFETLFQPYFKSNSPKDREERHNDLKEVFAAAVDHGLNCLAYSWGEVDYQWGERSDKIDVLPAMVTICRTKRGGPMETSAIAKGESWGQL